LFLKSERLFVAERAWNHPERDRTIPVSSKVSSVASIQTDRLMDYSLSVLGPPPPAAPKFAKLLPKGSGAIGVPNLAVNRFSAGLALSYVFERGSAKASPSWPSGPISLFSPAGGISYKMILTLV
jgi:hypothetical protein